MVQQIDYQYAPVPKKLMYCLDKNLKAMLFALVDLADYYNSNKFYRSNEDLQKDADLSKNLVIATLDTLYQNGLIDVDCIGKGVGRQTNIITLNTYKFKEWETYTFDEVRKLPERKINTVKYKGSGYRASYLDKNKVEVSCYSNLQEASQSSSQQVLQKVNTIEETQETQYSKENNIYKEIKNDLQKVNTCNNEKESEKKVTTNKDNIENISNKEDIDNTPTCKIIEEEKKDIYSSKVNIDNDIKEIVYSCFNNFKNKYKNLDYQLLLDNPEEFLKVNEIKLGTLSQSITSKTGIFFSREKTNRLLEEYINSQIQEIRMTA